ncbi:MAG: hypothetical protein ACI4GO_02215 [Hominenteromicrobium sp.]
MCGKRKGLALLLAAVLTVTAFSGCAGASERLEGELKEKITMGNYHVETDTLTGVGMTATVTMPDYSAYMLQYAVQAGETAKDEEDFEQKLYKLVLEAAAEAPADCTREISVNLSVLNEKKAQKDWTEKELIAAAQQAAFDAEVEEFCLELLSGSYFDAAASIETAESEAGEE